MSIVFKDSGIAEKKTMSAVYAQTVLELMEAHPDFIDIEADLGRSLLGPEVFEKMRLQYPNQFLDCGIQEANMMGVAAGMSLNGWVPFAHTFAAFASRRIVDQAFLSGSYARANVKIVGTDPGITAAFNGGTHMPFEDISIYRAFPEMIILDPSDSTMLRHLMTALYKTYGMCYLRLFRKNAVKIYDEDESFEIGKAKLVRQGKDVTVIAAGVMVAEALQAAKLLEEKGVSARVLDMFTIKPLDEAAVLAAAEETGAVVTAENHNIINGLGSAVADVLATKRPTPMEKIGIYDHFGEVGPMDYLKEKFHMTANDIAEAALRAIQRKTER